MMIFLIPFYYYAEQQQHAGREFPLHGILVKSLFLGGRWEAYCEHDFTFFVLHTGGRE